MPLLDDFARYDAARDPGGRRCSLRTAVLVCLSHGPATTAELAHWTGRLHHSLRATCTVLHREGAIRVVEYRHGPGRGRAVWALKDCM